MCSGVLGTVYLALSCSPGRAASDIVDSVLGTIIPTKQEVLHVDGNTWPQSIFVRDFSDIRFGHGEQDMNKAPGKVFGWHHLYGGHFDSANEVWAAVGEQR